ncbi:hypothetical protein WJX74_008096 [Apatococcus lobatus]|uniref:Protein kinase domain-containing protein n=1 Tax=Apatococcus lobatus TaxID=904363 RepID=A0AAW1RTN0_9CHLO
MLAVLLAVAVAFGSAAAQPGVLKPYGYLSQQTSNSTCKAACATTNGTSLDELCATDFNQTGLLSYGYTYLVSPPQGAVGKPYQTCLYTHLDTPADKQVAIMSTKHFWGPDYQWGWGACQVQDSISGANVWGMYIQERDWNASTCCLSCGDSWHAGQHLVPSIYANNQVSCMYAQYDDRKPLKWRTKATTDFKCGCLDLNAESVDMDFFNAAPPANDTQPPSATLQRYFASVNPSLPAPPAQKPGADFPAAAVAVPIVVIVVLGAALAWFVYRYRRHQGPRRGRTGALRSPWEETPPSQGSGLWRTLLSRKAQQLPAQRAVSSDLLVPSSLTRPPHLESSDEHSSTGSSLIHSLPEPEKTQELELASSSQIRSLIDFEAFLTGEAASGGVQSYAHGGSEEEKPPPTTQQVTRLVNQNLKGNVPDTWEVDLKALQLYKDAHGKPLRLGHGASGTVYKGLYRGVREVAVKVVSSPDPVAQARFVLEIATLREMRDPNIVLFMGASVQAGSTLLLMQFMQHGNLWEALRRSNDGSFGWYQGGQRIVREIASGMEYLHSNGYLHLDLKSPNVLLDEFDRAVVADIGLGKMANAESTVASGQTPLWASPEQRMGEPCSTASDVFSFGIILWEICAQEPLKLGIRRPLDSPYDCPKPVADLYKACCAQLAAERPSMKEIVRITFLSVSCVREEDPSGWRGLMPKQGAAIAVLLCLLLACQCTATGRAWSDRTLGSQNDGDWTESIEAPAGLYINAWKVGVALINFSINNAPASSNMSVLLAGRLNDGSWLPTLNATTPPGFYVNSSRPRGYRAIWGKAGGWLTGMFDGGGIGDGNWALNGGDAGLSSNARVVGYQLQIYGDDVGIIGDGTFLFDDTLP